ncbi:MAG: hypothetical protein ACKVQK_31500 [Burkholderiales bacterium]
MTQTQRESLRQYKRRMTQARLALRGVDVDIDKEVYKKAFGLYINARNAYNVYFRSCMSKGVNHG